MEKLKYRKATMSDLSDIVAIYERARTFMKETGNPTQWGTVYPSDDLIISDIEKGELYLAYGAETEGVFVLTEGEDPAYSYIEGKWLDDAPYRAVHRVASAGKRKGMISSIMDYCFSLCDSIRIDTHEDNAVMQHQLEKYGFLRCGIIYLENGEPRIAYQMIKE